MPAPPSPIRTAASWLVAAALCLFLARYDLRTDDTGVELFFLMIAGAILALIDPRRPWRWGLLLGGTILAAEIYNRIFGVPRPSLGPWWGYALVGLITMAAGCLGAFAAAGVRRLAR